MGTWEIRIKLAALIMHCCSVRCHFIPLRAKHFPQHPKSFARFMNKVEQAWQSAVTCSTWQGIDVDDPDSGSEQPPWLCLQKVDLIYFVKANLGSSVVVMISCFPWCNGVSHFTIVSVKLLPSRTERCTCALSATILKFLRHVSESMMVMNQIRQSG